MRLLTLILIINTLLIKLSYSDEIKSPLPKGELFSQYESLKLQSNTGSVSAQYKLFMLFFQNQQLLKSRSKESLYYLEMAASSQYIDAEFMLGALYQTGTLVGGKDFDKAKKLISRSAQRGNVDAQLMLANNYALRFSRASKLSDKKNYFSKAESWYLKVVLQGSTQAKRLYGLLLLRRSNKSNKGIQLLNEAAVEGDGSAMHSLGRHAEHLWAKQHVQKDYHLAIYWYKKAIAAGYSKAKKNMEILIEKGNKS